MMTTKNIKRRIEYRRKRIIFLTNRKIDGAVYVKGRDIKIKDEIARLQAEKDHLQEDLNQIQVQTAKEILYFRDLLGLNGDGI